jgi:RNA polymerase sigma-70 factor (ECF subfamily)
MMFRLAECCSSPRRATVERYPGKGSCFCASKPSCRTRPLSRVISIKGDKVVPSGSDGLDALYREIAPGLWRSIFIYAGARRDIADDAVAEAFTRALEAATEIREPKAWLYRVAFRVASVELRKGSTESLGVNHEVGSDEPTDLLPVLEALSRLPPNQRAAVVLHYRLDLSVRQIADALGIAPATVKVHLHRGRNRLRQMLQEDEDA